ncbi:MAG: hypothetical protein QW620_06675 [Thermoplasmata archaeon]
MEAMKVVFSDGNVDLCVPAIVDVPADTVLRKGLYPFSNSITQRICSIGIFKINDKIIEGFPVSSSARELFDFWIKYSVNGKAPSQLYHYLHDDDLLDSYPIPKSIVDCERIVVKDETYLFLHAGIGVVYSWEEKNGTLQPVMCGMVNIDEEKIYFYYSGYTKENAILRTTDKVEKIPRGIMESLKKRYGYCGIQKGDDCSNFETRRRRYGLHIIREKYASMRQGGDLVDVNPYPPYQIVHAIKLLPPEDVNEARNPVVPPNFTENYLVRTFLYTADPIPFSVLSADELRGIAKYVHSTFYFYGTQTENPLGEYTEIWENSCGYLLFCKPAWPF